MISRQPIEGEAFLAWWSEKQNDLVSKPPKTLAEAAWNAAVREVVAMFQGELDELVKNGDYESAAAVRDCRPRAEGLFSQSGLWDSSLLGWEMDFPLGVPGEEAYYRQFFAKFFPDKLAKIRLFLPMNAAAKAAIESLITENRTQDSP
jgi:hypothetical protein